MKHSIKKYAQALSGSLLEKKTDQKQVAVNFLKLLKRNGDVKKGGAIVALAQDTILKKAGNKKITFETARKIDIKDLMKSFVKKGDTVQEKINPALIAGVKIEVDGQKQLDLSLKSKLDNIF